MVVAVAASQVAPGANRLHKDLKFPDIFTHCTLRLSNQQSDIELKAMVFSSGEIILTVERIRHCDLLHSDQSKDYPPFHLALSGFISVIEIFLQVFLTWSHFDRLLHA